MAKINWLKDNQQEDQGGAFFSNNGFKSCKKFVHSKKTFFESVQIFFDLATTINLVGGLFACLFKVSVIKRQKIDEPVIISSNRGRFYKA